MNQIVTRAALLGAASLLALVGGALLTSPREFLSMSDILIPRDPSLLSELSAPAGLLIAAAVAMALGAFRSRFAEMGLLVGTIIYGTYGVSRIVSMLIHGLPSKSMIIATIVEVGVALCLRVLMSRRARMPKRDLPHASPWEIVV